MDKNKINIKESLRNIKLSWKFAKKNKKYLFLYIIFDILICVIGVFLPILSAKQLLCINGSDFNSLINITLFILIIGIGESICRFIASKVSELFFRETLTDLQIELANATLNIETEEIDKNSSGIFIDRLNRDTGDIADIFGLITDVLIDVVVNIGVIGVSFVVNKVIFVYFLIALIILSIINSIKIRKRYEEDKEFRKLREKNTGLISEMVRGIRDVKSLGCEGNFIKLLKKRLYDTNKQRYKMSKVNMSYTFLSENVTGLFALGFILLGIKEVLNGSLTIEGFVVLYMYEDRIYTLLDYAIRMFEYFKNYSLSASRVFEVLDESIFKKEKYGNISLDVVKGNFEFRNVSFNYGNKNETINNLSFKINADETVAFVGRSGAGKSTIFNLLTKMYHPKSGDIYIDGVNIENLTKDTIRNNISIINQNPYIFNFTIKENLKIVNDNASDKEIIDACKKAQLHDFIMTLPDKYDTLVGEGGITLSGGQKQRLAIARAFIKGSEIMLFDESTSALDNETQKGVQDAINNLKGDHTILIIAHRLSTVINSDRILLIDDGKIVGEGTHKDLLKNNKLYSELYNSEIN